MAMTTSGSISHVMSSNFDSESESETESCILRLPDVIIQHGILSYRPFLSIRVILIRSTNNEQDHHLISTHKKQAVVVFRSNRGPIRFRVTELLYLPQNTDNNDNNDDEDNDNENKHKDDIYQNADGVIISCYIRRFHEYCHRYEYANSLLVTTPTSTSIRTHNNDTDMTATIATATGTRAAANEEERRVGVVDVRTTAAATTSINNIPRQRKRTTATTLTTVVLCGNDTNVTQIDAQYSSIVFTTTNTKSNSNSSNNDRNGTISTSARSKCTTFTDTPRHPFASLARNITNDNDLDFI
eukprot:CAMPEP_0170780300 /NCGR_PEP_ID=MMETSP0733-20121128/13499_1 /TAXON_ID=186038 /ORGANISM="Fragilariopsis kerguelensis, Strain L26-C5" /LENGTH=298 /DNA_ID=CAMNT_0011124077 /DNA_START=78 /DNA_END=974 /DNA_ORIENTATION=+